MLPRTLALCLDNMIGCDPVEALALATDMVTIGHTTEDVGIDCATEDTAAERDVVTERVIEDVVVGRATEGVVAGRATEDVAAERVIEDIAEEHATEDVVAERVIEVVAANGHILEVVVGTWCPEEDLQSAVRAAMWDMMAARSAALVVASMGNVAAEHGVDDDVEERASAADEMIAGGAAEDVDPKTNK